MSDAAPRDESPTSELKRSIATAYVREMLDLNPIYQSPQILRRRREIWGVGQPANALAKSASGANLMVDPESEREFRARAKTCLDKLRTKFYEIPDESLAKYLRIISSNRVPEYSATSKRLRAIAPHRPTLLRAFEETGDVKFSYSLQFAMIGTAARAGALREQYIESLIADRRVAEGCKTVQTYVERHPEIYQVDHDWFDALLDPSNQRNWSSSYSNVSRIRRFFARPKSNLTVVLIFIALSVFGRVMRNIDDDDKRSPPVRNPIPAQPKTPDALIKTPDATAEKIERLQEPDRLRKGRFAPPTDVPNLPTPTDPRTPNPPVVMPDEFRRLFPGVERLLPEPSPPGMFPGMPSR